MHSILTIMTRSSNIISTHTLVEFHIIIKIWHNSDKSRLTMYLIRKAFIYTLVKHSMNTTINHTKPQQALHVLGMFFNKLKVLFNNY